MAKRVTLLRHAKSSWDDPVLRDFDRPLNRRGARAARTVGREMRALGLAFDAVIVSPAARAVETLAGIEEGYGGSLGAARDERVYLATPDLLLELVHETDGAAQSLLILGHNPGLHQFALRLGSEEGEKGLRGELLAKYPTASLAEIEFETDNWHDVRFGGGCLTRFVRPRDLDPELGPGR
ncbi:MAG: histidine phosphatase family protein [Sphingomonadaceae bacterium]